MKKGAQVLVTLLIVGVLITEPWKPEVHWSDAPRPELQGLWVNESGNPEKVLPISDTLRLRSNTLVLVQHWPDGTPQRRVCTPIHRVSRAGDEYVIFCGNRNLDDVAETRIEMHTTEGFDEAVVGRIVGTGINGNVAYFSVGRFTKKH